MSNHAPLEEAINPEIRTQLKAYWRQILALVVLALLVLASALWGMSFPGVDDYKLFSDPIAVLGGKPYIGLYSQFGLLLWAACAAICFFSATLLKEQADKKRFRQYLTACGALCVWLGLDDTYLFHENVPYRFGVREEVVMYLYIAIVLILFAVFYRTLLRTPYVFLGLTAVMFFFSVAGDFYGRYFRANGYLIEEWPKLAGLIFLTAYFYQTGRAVVRSDGD